ncbi:hypothetical protein PspS04_14285 [Pseudomonas sp. S04]|nr:hypothetical protein PspS04_11555 [Pseudomonas sp. S04]QHD01453.1 hypothetical protein PspS04_14285 [Pseudomonas sp. S04]QHF33437.1 hypothetical protein PspS19_11560 [Pseudomonas sp. S19]QHF33937.1 hypothetical protein PspS19_14290 [Pseudomonas sp. S19]
MSEYGHAEPKRGTEWWGKSVLLTFALFKSEPPSGGTIGGRYRKNGYVLRLIQHPRGPEAATRASSLATGRYNLV